MDSSIPLSLIISWILFFSFINITQRHAKHFEDRSQYLKPTPKKVLFKWSEIQSWIGDSNGNGDGYVESSKNSNSSKKNEHSESDKNNIQNNFKSLIKIWKYLSFILPCFLITELLVKISGRRWYMKGD